MNRMRLWKSLPFLGACLSLSPAAFANCGSPSVLTARDDSPGQAWNETSWVALQPTKDLQWIECYPGGFQCTRLQLPLNYSNPEGGSADIALIRLRANVSTDSEEYRGPMIFNPGGPGGSGVDQILTEGAQFQAIFPQFDIVGFDPRGVQRSTPQISFYKSSAERYAGPVLATELNHSSWPVELFWAQTKVMGALAYERNGDVLRYMNTENVARDMLAITEAHGREKLQYCGVSYGSVLGATFAALFPVGSNVSSSTGFLMLKMTITPVPSNFQAIYDLNSYKSHSNAAKWLTSLLDADKTLEWFFKSCHEAGVESCPFYEPSVEEMGNKLNKLYDSVIKAPVLVQKGAESYSIVDYARLKSIIMRGLYFPFSFWPRLAVGLADLEKGNGTVIDAILPDGTLECDCDLTDNGFEVYPENRMAYICNDGDFVPPDVEEAQRHYEESAALSSFGSFWSRWYIACNGWSRSIPKAQFRGPITGNTSFPLLVIGNTADPVTPLSSARKVSSNFPGSVLLQRDAPGHPGSILMAPSKCTVQAIVDYFVSGTLPEEGTVCPVDRSPFDVPEEA
ncbi:hypothetical protein PQX77_006183 [Marasmius sp. AFHP31]|nr:hypothetical protein PQX77_006183 [Marasmius sp. AFHP31]